MPVHKTQSKENGPRSNCVELAELTEALATKRPLLIRDEAADVANFLMMLCQNNKALDFANDAPCKPAQSALEAKENRGL